VRNKTVVLVIVLFCGAALLFFLTRRSSTTIKTDDRAPSFEIKDALTGKILSSTDLRDKVIFLNFWASWCEVCKEEMPSVDALYGDMAQRKDFVMVTVLYKDSPDNAFAYMKSKGYHFPVFIDPGNVARNFGVTGVPETYIIDKKGMLAKRVIGGLDWIAPEEINMIKTLL
jgi:cytochrome c biogenesis protein CcmG/thiol:disulfide interchange protein DsbE